MKTKEIESDVDAILAREKINYSVTYKGESDSPIGCDSEKWQHDKWVCLFISGEKKENCCAFHILPLPARLI